MFLLFINLIIYSLFIISFEADVAVFYTKQDENNLVLHYIRENYVASFKVVVERENYCPNFEDITIINNNVCTLPIVFYPFLNKTNVGKNNCFLKEQFKKNNINNTYLDNLMEIKHSKDIWIISATKKDKKFTSIIIKSSPNFHYNIQTAVKNVMNFIEEEHFHECKTKKKVKRFAFITQISSDFVVISRQYFICVMILLLLSLSIGMFLLIKHFVTGTNKLKNESVV